MHTGFQYCAHHTPSAVLPDELGVMPSSCGQRDVCVCVTLAGVKPEPASPHTPLPSAAAASAGAACPPCDDGVLVCIYPGCDEVYGAGEEGAYMAHVEAHF